MWPWLWPISPSRASLLSCTVEHLTQHHTHTLYRHTNPQCTLLADAIFISHKPFGLLEMNHLGSSRGCFFAYLWMCRQLLPKTLQNTSHGSIHTALNSSLSLSPTVNSSHFFKNKNHFFRIHRYSAILDSCVSCLGLKCQTDNWMLLPGLTVKINTNTITVITTSQIYPSSKLFVLCRIAGMLELISASRAKGRKTPWMDDLLWNDFPLFFSDVAKPMRSI